MHIMSEMALGLSDRLNYFMETRYPDLFDGCQIHDCSYLLKFCHDNSIKVIISLHVNDNGLIINPIGQAVIILPLDKLLPESENSRHVFAMKIAGILLLHPGIRGGIDNGIVGSTDSRFAAFSNDRRIALERSIMALMIIMPDTFLNQLIEIFTYIPAEQLRLKLNISLESKPREGAI